MKCNIINKSLPLMMLAAGVAYSGLLPAEDCGGVPRAEGVRSGQQMLEAVAGEVKNIDTAGLQQLLEKRPETVVIDVRTPEEIAALGGMIEAQRNHNITRGWLEFRVGDAVPSPDTPIVVYCGRNERSPWPPRP